MHAKEIKFMCSYTSEIPTFVFHDGACSSPSVQKASTWTCIFASLAPLLWSFLILYPLHPRQFVCLSSGLLLYFGHNFLLYLSSYIVYFLTLLPSVLDCELLGCGNGVIIFPVSPVPTQHNTSVNQYLFVELKFSQQDCEAMMIPLWELMGEHEGRQSKSAFRVKGE